MPKFSTNTVIDIRAQDDLVREQGEWLWYFKGSRCPCGTELNKPDFACANCQGLGHFYPDPPVWMRAIVSKIELSREPFGIPGYVVPGDLIMVVRPNRGRYWNVYDFDMVQLTMLDGIPLEGEDLIADPSGVDRLQHPVVELKSAYSMDQLSPVGPNQPVAYTMGVDCVPVEPIEPNKYSQSIRWLTANRPAPGTKYVVQYSTQPFWIIFNPPTPHVVRSVPYGQSVIIRKRSIVLASMS